jgi:hypothetical protein
MCAPRKFHEKPIIYMLYVKWLRKDLMQTLILGPTFILVGFSLNNLMCTLDCEDVYSTCYFRIFWHFKMSSKYISIQRSIQVKTMPMQECMTKSIENKQMALKTGREHQPSERQARCRANWQDTTTARSISDSPQTYIQRTTKTKSDTSQDLVLPGIGRTTRIYLCLLPYSTPHCIGFHLLLFRHLANRQSSIHMKKKIQFVNRHPPPHSLQSIVTDNGMRGQILASSSNGSIMHLGIYQNRKWNRKASKIQHEHVANAVRM